MKRMLVPSVALLIVTAGVATAAVKSGLQVGDSAGAFNVKSVSDPVTPAKEGKSLCYR